MCRCQTFNINIDFKVVDKVLLYNEQSLHPNIRQSQLSLNDTMKVQIHTSNHFLNIFDESLSVGTKFLNIEKLYSFSIFCFFSCIYMYRKFAHRQRSDSDGDS